MCLQYSEKYPIFWVTNARRLEIRASSEVLPMRIMQILRPVWYQILTPSLVKRGEN